MSPTPEQRLSKALCNLTSGGKPELLVALARSWGIDGLAARRAAKGFTVSASNYLQLCSAIGLNPVTWTQHVPQKVAGLDWRKLAASLRSERQRRHHSLRDAAPVIGLCIATLSRVENCGNKASPLTREQSIGSVLAVCRYVGMHPYDFLKMSNVKQRRKHSDRATELVHA